MNEPSVLDYLKDRLQFWRRPRLFLPEVAPMERLEAPVNERLAEGDSAGRQTSANEPWTAQALAEHPARQKSEPIHVPWLTLAGFGLAVLAQSTFEPNPNVPDGHTPMPGILLYAASASLIALAFWRSQWQPAPLRDDSAERPGMRLKLTSLAFAAGFGLLAFIFFGKPFGQSDSPTALNNLLDNFGGERFTTFNLVLWALTLAFFLTATWQPTGRSGRRWLALRRWLANPRLTVSITPFALVTALTVALVIFFRFYRLDGVPAEMVSDHAEKLWDVQDVLNGNFFTYFPRNTGREFFQFYLTAAVILIFKTGISFLALKIGTTIASLATMPYIYLLGKELGNRWVGILAVLMAGMAYFTNMFTRIGLRFALYPLFVAPCLFYLIRGLRTRSRNDFILSGIALGIGLHGYTSIRILPFLVVIGVGLYIAHRQSRGARLQAVFHLGLLSSAALVVFIPLLRFWQSNPDMFALRTMTRLTSIESPLPGPAHEIFLNNLWRALTMFFWDNGETWVHSITHRPALDVISAALFFAGVTLLLVRYLRQRSWVDLFMLISVPILMMPSILSLAFPAENPSLNRTSGVIVPVFVIMAIALEGMFSAVRRGIPGLAGTLAVGALGLALLVPSAAQNYDLVFNQYNKMYRASAWNYNEVGGIIRAFGESVGDMRSAWVVAYPHWVDTRIVGITAGMPGYDYAIWPDQLTETVENPHAKLFLVNLQDMEGLSVLRSLYPNGVLRIYHSVEETKDFYQYLVLPEGGIIP